MGRHSRRGPADQTDTTGTSHTPRSRTADTPSDLATGSASAPSPSPSPTPGTGRRRRAAEAQGDGAQGAPAKGTPKRGAPSDGTPAHGIPANGTPPHGTPAHGTPAHGTPAHGTPAHGVPAQGTPPHGTPAHGALPHGTPPQGTPHVRGGHPEQREPGGGWGDGGPGASPGASPGAGTGAGASAGVGVRRGRAVPGPRQDYVAAFPDELPEGFEPAVEAGESGDEPPAPRDPYASVTDWRDADGLHPDDLGGDEPDTGVRGGRRRGRVLAAVAAVAVTAVVAVVVAGQLTGGSKGSAAGAKASPGGPRDTEDPASRSDRRPPPAKAPETYDDKMRKTFPMDPKLKASGDFEAMSGFDKAPGKGQLFRYRVDVEKGLGLDGELFAQAVQKTLNDDRSWAHGHARTFERISSGRPDFVVTLASPGTTGTWCAKSGLDTTQDNVSCDSAATDRVMINAYRWAQGAKTYGDAVKKEFGSAILPYRQMLINHEVGHRLGHNHTDCTKSGDLAPVMQQQTKFLEHDGIKCKANPWVFPKS
ncbi:DUF3152 domain-containing protein [Streptomyces sp. NPDC005562]|uniref:DUF3152 domain-containing protein n=1 Tax=Streptomyces sp. NPDC005562 TaxID=3154890 RepID=UPI0033AF944B